jgi:hypothetical protein
MIIRNKSGEFSVRSRVALLDYLQGVMCSGGKVKEDVSVFVPITLKEQIEKSKEQIGINKEQLAMKSNTVPWTFSTFDLDRYDERVDPRGWELGQFKKKSGGAVGA